MATDYPLITLEEHFLSPSLHEVHQDLYKVFPPHIVSNLKEVGQGRLSAMDAGKVQRQVLSHAPGAGAPQVCRETNDFLAAAVAKHPDRLSGFATLPMAHPQAAAEELRRCVKELKLVGTLVENHTEGLFYDGPEHHVFWEEAESLNTVVYMHPALPDDKMVEALYKGNYGARAEWSLGASGWGWHAETGLHFLRLYSSGLFDRFPKLKLVLGHFGEMLPYQLDRNLRMEQPDGHGGFKGAFGEHKRGLKQVVAENLWITTSGMFSLAPLVCCLRVIAPDRLLFSVDWPFSSNETGYEYIQAIRSSGLMDENALEDFCYRNAAKLLGL